MPRAKWQTNQYKKTEEVLAKIEDILKIDWTIEEASYYAGIDPVTYYRRVKDDENLCKRFEKAKQYPFILARKTLMKGMQDGDNRAAIEYLKRRDRRYYDKSIVDNKNTEIKITEEQQNLIEDILGKNIIDEK